MLGPVLDLFGSPIALIKKAFRDPALFRLWQEDVRYYFACGFFNGRTAPNFTRMRTFERDCGPERSECRKALW
jgi:hypothetical protein